MTLIQHKTPICHIPLINLLHIIQLSQQIRKVQVGRTRDVIQNQMILIQYKTPICHIPLINLFPIIQPSPENRKVQVGRTRGVIQIDILAIFVERTAGRNRILSIICEYTLERNLTNVTSVCKHFPPSPLYRLTSVYILERNHSRAPSVA